MSTPRYPALFQVNTRVRLSELSKELGRPATLDDVPDAELDAKAVEIAGKLADGPAHAIRWTKHTLNHWLRTAGPAFDASAALEMLGFTGPEPREGLAAHREKRKPKWT